MKIVYIKNMIELMDKIDPSHKLGYIEIVELLESTYDFKINERGIIGSSYSFKCNNPDKFIEFQLKYSEYIYKIE